MAKTESTEWQKPDSDSIPVIVPSSDLFEGELLGDELVEIYNAAVGECTDNVTPADLPTLLPQVTDGEEQKKPDEVQSGQVAAATSADSGLATCKPANSVDEPAPTPSVDIGPKMIVSDATVTPKSGIDDPGKKRVADAEANPPPAKKQCTKPEADHRVVANPTTPPPTAPTEAQTQSHVVAEPSSRDAVCGEGPPGVEDKPCTNGASTSTPDPLTSGTGQVATSITVKTEAAPITASPPAVVSPQPTKKIETEIPRPDSSSVIAAAGAVPVPVLSAPKRQTTEADFKAVAQAAVSSLIASVGAGNTTYSKAESSQVTVKTTGIVGASTSTVKSCSGTAVCSAASAVAMESKANANNKAKKQNLTPEERAQQNRDRNREHARNTRLRKKAYVEELKRTLTELVSQRDASELERQQAAQRELDQREVRFRVIEEFLKLRGRNEIDSSRWAAILENGFTLVLPVTRFRKMVHSENNQAVLLEQVLTGVSDVMADSNNFAAFLQSYGGGNNCTRVTFLYHCDRSKFFMDGCNAVLDWTATSFGAVKQGAKAELSLRGTIKAAYSPASNKLLSATIIFDTGLVSSQLNHSDALDEKAAAAAAEAQAAYSEADAILDSLQVPHIEAAPVVVKSSSSAVSVTSSEKEENSSDESLND